MAIEKKISAAKSNSSPSPSLHPPYFQMICEAITLMKDRTGSSQPAIAKFVDENYAQLLPPNFRKNISAQLKRLVKSEKLVKVRNSYKISAPEKPKKSSKVEKAKKMKRLSEVKTPEALKKKAICEKTKAGSGTRATKGKKN